MIEKYAIRILLLIAVIGAAKGLIFFPRDPGNLIIQSIAGHEWEYNLWRIIGMADAFADGMPGRWLHAFSHGWGYPLFHYTSPLPYTVGGLLMLLGFDVHAALNLCWILALCGSGWVMFRACRPILGEWGALLAATCYLFAPYHLVDIYVRTNLVESTAFLFPPIILWALWRCRDESIRPVVLGAIAIALLPLSHILSSYIIGLGLIVFSIVYTLLLPAKSRLLFLQRAVLMGVFGLALSVFFWLPAIGDLSAVRGFDAIVAGDYDYRRHFVYPLQLFSNDWEYGGSNPGPIDHMSFSLGISIVIFGLLTGILAVVHYVKSRISSGTENPHSAQSIDQARFVIACLIAGLVMVFLTLNASLWFWKIIPGMAAVQFPWRFLMPASLLLAVVAGALPALIRPYLTGRLWAPAFLGIAATLIVMTLHWEFARQGSHYAYDRQNLIEEQQMYLGVWTTNQLEFLPVGAEQPYKETKRTDAARFLDSAYVPQARIEKSEIENGKALITMIPGESGTLILHQHWHPAWKASINGLYTDTFPFSSHPFKPVAITVPAEAYIIEFRYGFTGIGLFSLWLSILVGAGGLVYLALQHRRSLLKMISPAAVYFGSLLAVYALSGSPYSRSLQATFDATGKQIKAADYADIKALNTAWDHAGNAIFDKSGLKIDFDEIQHSSSIQFSLDSNDTYLIIYARHDRVFDNTAYVFKRDHSGLSPDTVKTPAEVSEQGFDSIAILPINGDEYYSLGHVATDIDRAPFLPLHIDDNSRTVPFQALLAEVLNPREPGTLWDAPGNIQFTETGLDIHLPGASQTQKMEISLDSNDYYLLVFFLAGKPVGTVDINPSAHNNSLISGLAVYAINIPPTVQAVGFDRVGIRPIMGDNYYSLGHLILSSE